MRDPIDYHMLLYGRSKELRNILIGLIEKLPRDSPVVTSANGKHCKKILVLHHYVCFEIF